MRSFDKNYSLIRIINAVVENDDSLDINVDGKVLFRDITFTDFTPYVYMPEGEYLLEVYKSQDKTSPIFTENINIEKDKLFSIAIVGEKDNLSLIKIEDDKNKAKNSLSKARFVHLVPNGKAVNVVLDDKTYAYNVGYKEVTPYTDLEPKVYDTQIELSSNNQLIRQLRVNMNPNKIYTFYAMGNKPNFQIFQSSDGDIWKK